MNRQVGGSGKNVLAGNKGCELLSPQGCGRGCGDSRDRHGLGDGRAACMSASPLVGSSRGGKRGQTGRDRPFLRCGRSTCHLLTLTAQGHLTVPES